MADKERLTDYITRDMYRQMKSMNREKFCDFLYNLYNNIYEEKCEADLDKIRTEVKKISGIGDVKAEQIVEIVKNCTNNEDGDA